MIPLRLYHRIYLSLLLAMLAALALTALISQRLLGEGARGPYAERLTAEARAVAAALPPASAPADEQSTALWRAAEPLELEATLFDEAGRVLASNTSERRQLAAGIPRGPWVLAMGRGGQPYGLADGRRLVVRPRVTPPRHGRLVMALVGLFVVLAIASWPVARSLTRRLERLDRGVRRLGAGDLKARVEVSGADEVARLAGSLNWAAERMERLIEAHRRVLRSASHELRSPLARLRMALELMREGGGPDVARRVDDAAAEIAELDGQIEDILLASRLEAGAPGTPGELVDLSALLTAEAAPFDAAVEGAPVSIVGDASMLRRMVRNLLDNARRYAGGGSSAGVEPLGGGGARLWVADRGPGVPPEECERLFEPFYRSGRQGESRDGVGLGLALVREIAEHHGGQASCRPREGGGMLFEVTLRAVREGETRRPK